MRKQYLRNKIAFYTHYFVFDTLCVAEADPTQKLIIKNICHAITLSTYPTDYKSIIV